MKTITLVSDKNNWILPGFYHQWEKYYPEVEPITFGYTKPDFFNHPFVSLGAQESYPASRWSDALIRVLKDYVDDNLVMILLEDYFLTRRANVRIINLAWKFMIDHPEAVRFDLTTDRQYSGKWKNYSAIEDVDIIEALPCEYYLSMQAAIWNKARLLSILQPGETPWQTEMLGSDRLAQTGMKVFGTMQYPLRYQIMIRDGQLVMDGAWHYPARQLSDADVTELRDMKYLPE
jgi:hypothetical protein